MHKTQAIISLLIKVRCWRDRKKIYSMTGGKIWSRGSQDKRDRLDRLDKI